MKYVFFLSALVTAALVYISHADALVKVKVGPKPEQKTSTVEVIGVESNGDGSSTLFVSACGTLLSFTVRDIDLVTQENEIVKLMGQQIEKACE